MDTLRNALLTEADRLAQILERQRSRPEPDAKAIKRTLKALQTVREFLD